MFNFMKTAGLGLLMVAARSIAADVSRALFWDKISWERHVGRTQAEGPAALHRRKPVSVVHVLPFVLKAPAARTHG